MKNAEQEQSLAYVFLLKRLAYVCFLNNKFADAEKYFKICLDLVPLATKNPSNLFSAQMNLLLLYTHTDIEKAASFGEMLMTRIEDSAPAHAKELMSNLANVYALQGQMFKAKAMYRNVLK